MAPWAERYTVGLDKVKTRLTIGQYQETTDYMELFMGMKGVSPTKRSRVQYSMKKILVRGVTGTGKSVLAKKIALDWAKGEFAIFPIVFYVDMNLAKVDDTIEEIIINQSGLAKDELDFEILRSQCLVIIDGFKFCKPHANVYKFVQKRGTKILVTTSDSLDASEAEKLFDVVCDAKGFQEKDAENFISEIGARQAVLQGIKVSLPGMFEGSVTNNPMLTTFLCLLREKGSETSQDQEKDKAKTENVDISLCGMYFKLVQFLSNSRDDKVFMDLIKNIGKQALAQLQCGTDIPNNDDWLAKGFVVERSNGLCFAHGSLEVFLASLYFVLSLQTAEIEDLDSTAIFLVDPLFLYFCLALLNESETFGVQKKEVSYKKLKRYVLDKIDLVQLDLQYIALLFPALDISDSHIHENDVILKFVLNAIKSCEKTRDLILVPNLPVGKILNAVNITCSKLNLIELGNKDTTLTIDTMRNITGSNLNILIDDQSGNGLDELLNYLDGLKRTFSIIYQGGYYSRPMVEFALYAKPNAQQIIFFQNNYIRCDIITRKEIPTCPNLQSLYFGPGVRLGTKSVKAFCEATKNGKFSSLNQIGITCSASKEFVQLFHDKSNLSLEHVSFQGFNLDTKAASTLFPTLSSLEIDKELPEPLKEPLTNLVKLRIHGDFREFADHCPSLVSLEITPKSKRIPSMLENITLEKLPELHELSLQGRGNVLPEKFAQNDCLWIAFWSLLNTLQRSLLQHC